MIAVEAMKMKLQSISTVTKNLDISTRTLRYYEMVGLIESERPADYAYRMYSEETIARIRQILLLRKLLIPLKKIKLILDNPDAAVAVAVFAQSIRELNEEIGALQTVRDILSDLSETLQSSAGVSLSQRLFEEKSLLAAVQLLSPAPQTRREKRGTKELNKASRQLQKLSDSDVRIVYLPPGVVASALGIGDESAHEADIMMAQFLRDMDLFRSAPGTRLFGFNNPQFEPDGTFLRHQYEVWATIPADFAVPAPLTQKAFRGGLYAAYTCKPINFDDWKLFGAWLAQCEDFVFDADRTYRADTAADHKVRCSGWGCLEEHFNSYDLYGLKDKKHLLTHMDFLIPIKPNE